MPRIKKEDILKIAKNDIIELLDNLPSKILKYSDLENILLINRKNWRVTTTTTVNEFISFLLDQTKLKEAKFNFPYRPELRYIWGEVSNYELIMSLRPDSYFTHYTAMYLHEITEQIPNTFYLNYEQSPKRKHKENLEQDRIDSAFKRPVRSSKNIAFYNNFKICLLNGMYTGKLGVVEILGLQREKIRVTNIERTLIDITVRPEYSGGVFEVLKAFQFAHDNVSINKLTAMFKKLDYTYPYHQAIGFYLEKAGVYNQSQVDLLCKFDFEFDFYLTHQMKETDYSKKWRLYYPKGL
ncbi:MAG: hypothetical protein Q8O10_02740 [candidate division Zixibacteria bacterium]|nr:hypothetical protein [candidate division Zixibacteria bacterium]